jgi:hypothetical protein
MSTDEPEVEYPLVEGEGEVVAEAPAEPELHECPACHLRFEDLRAHERATGKYLCAAKVPTLEDLAERTRAMRERDENVVPWK